ncbi:MAG: transketolase [Deltaproteobacteria bacterium]|nr:transketolase [Deltaproteobacteria bacterium]
MDSTTQKIEHATQMAVRMRKNILRMANAVGGNSHIGGGLSIVDITATLFGAVMRVDPKNPTWPERDRFILSKGHGILGYYTALAEVGYITEIELLQFEKNDSFLLGHPVMNRAKGIEFSTGSLGMGLSLGIGVSLAAKRRGQSHRTFVILGDGECNEGSVWEGFLAAPHFKLDNLVAIVDRNNLQQTGANKDIMSVGNMGAKLKDFGWDVTECDGHSVDKLYQALSTPPSDARPKAIVAHTIKGKGLKIAENNNDFHHGALTQAQLEVALKEISS